MDNNDTITVIFEGQQYPIAREIANNDDTLKILLSSFIPAAATAKIERTDHTVRLIKQSGTKGHSTLEFLKTQPQHLNPALITAWKIQYKILSGVDLIELQQLSEEAQSSIKLGEEEIENYNNTLKFLKSITASPSPYLPITF